MAKPRLRRSASSVVAAAVVAATFLTTPAAGGEELSTFKADQARTGHLREGPRPPLRLRWKFPSRETRSQIEAFYTTDDGFSPASVHAGVVYAGGHDGWIYAIDARSGKKLWEHKTGGHVMTTPQYREGRVFAGSMDGYLRALDARDGSLVWQVQFGARMWNGLRYSGMRATPLFYGGKLFMGG
ncbi:MAG TPA: PQQ-binding-like beta-propeller repeat protein [Candidatus Methanoperedens sp.]|nr:PQQ-binding-like beta-propeller repeat protein [Candidatus Methanoperedens sp.]